MKTIKTMSSGKINVLLSTMHPLNDVTKDAKKEKLKICKIHNFTKIRMDIVCQLNDCYPVRS